MVFILIQPALPGELSDTQSNIIVSMLQKLTDAFFDVLSLIVRKAAQFAEYMLLWINLAVNAFEWSKIKKVKWSTLSLWSTEWTIGTVYVVTDEIHQYFLLGRACAVMYMTIDSVRVAADALLIILASKSPITVNAFSQ